MPTECPACGTPAGAAEGGRQGPALPQPREVPGAGARAGLPRRRARRLRHRGPGLRGGGRAARGRRDHQRGRPVRPRRGGAAAARRCSPAPPRRARRGRSSAPTAYGCWPTCTSARRRCRCGACWSRCRSATSARPRRVRWPPSSARWRRSARRRRRRCRPPRASGPRSRRRCASGSTAPARGSADAETDGQEVGDNAGWHREIVEKWEAAGVAMAGPARRVGRRAPSRASRSWPPARWRASPATRSRRRSSAAAARRRARCRRRPTTSSSATTPAPRPTRPSSSGCRSSTRRSSSGCSTTGPTPWLTSGPACTRP